MNPVIRARVITCSDKAAGGERLDESGPALRDHLEAAGYEVDRVIVVPDQLESIARAIVTAVDADGIRLVVTTGGTGVSPRDVTPEATSRVADRLIPGIGELMRARSLERTPMAPLSRAQAATRKDALILNLPGSPAGAVENLTSVLDLLPHALELLSGTPIEHSASGSGR